MLRIKILTAKKEKVFLIPGEEIVAVNEEGKTEGDILVYFLQKEIPPTTFENILDEVKKYGQWKT